MLRRRSAGPAFVVYSSGKRGSLPSWEQVDDLVNRASIVQHDEHAAVTQQGPIQAGHRLPPVWYMPLFNTESADQVAQCFLGGDRAIDFGEAA